MRGLISDAALAGPAFEARFPFPILAFENSAASAIVFSGHALPRPGFTRGGRAGLDVDQGSSFISGIRRAMNAGAIITDVCRSTAGVGELPGAIVAFEDGVAIGKVAFGTLGLSIDTVDSGGLSAGNDKA